ncbi:MAG: TIGR00282 family metallophosphoesterase [Paracoccaceae bacterium]|nr:TIGR00282 family metallophosphoesterase [Paracoccaceae bacterium]
MNILFLGDIVGRSGRDALEKELPRLRKELKLDFVVVNAENATAGVGLSIDHAKHILTLGVDCITLGDHAFDQREMITFIQQEPRILRPLNFAKTAPGRGADMFRTSTGKRVLVTQVLGQVFMKKNFSDPFSGLDSVLNISKLGKACDAVIVDVHAEATSEKMALGHWCDGRVTLVVGTHTHIPTSDLQILNNGTAYQTDAGMSGDYNSVIGMDRQEPIQRFVTGMSKGRFVPANGAASLCGVFLEVGSSGFAKRACAVRVGGILEQVLPKLE